MGVVTTFFVADKGVQPVNILDEQAAFALFAGVVKLAHRDARKASGRRQAEAIDFLRHLGVRMYRDFEREAAQIDAQFAQNVALLDKRDDLSPKGLAEQRERLDAMRRQQVAELQQRARYKLEADTFTNGKALAEARAEQIAQLRKTLGDAILADIYVRRLALRTGPEVVRAYAEAVPGWEQTLIGALGIALLEERQENANPPNMEDELALAELERLTTPEAVRELELKAREVRNGERWLESLDAQGYRASMADKLGVQAEYVPLPYAVAA